MSRIDSPCIASCKLDQDKICIGCYRHISEIANWNRKTDTELDAIMQQVARRKRQYADMNHHSIETSPITQAEWQAAKIKARLS
ncbi:DUF1289 domain-containing protein [Alkalimonas amylolytica]|uniref:Predicted Fe-S protein YdhL, DUF1289 family n=1 Tax=Alkalimonas amylolytica TaxID=152573 RepID=A0A1H4A631_ALKAM|nr:DUF1289 domain-containing protein [Alkalimonas amylolytica]SEA31583.1 Predicted Fe-S protein YdhL, DUF1289 family [Alkalimonas amylolytica]